MKRRHLVGPWSSFVENWGRASGVRSIQRGTITLNNVTSATATITAVRPEHTLLRFLGQTYAVTSVSEAIGMARITLTDATTVTATQQTANANDHVVSFEAIEYWPGVIRSIQRGTVAVGTPATITAVQSLTKTTLDFLGFSSTVTTFDDNDQPYLALTNATTVTATATANGATASYQVVEWY